MRVLIAEDDKRVAALLKEWLTAERMAVDICHDGREAVLLANAAPYDVIVLDVMMPEMDGFEAMKRIREAGIASPAIFLTAKDAVEDRVHGLNVGADDYLVKPFAVEELIARIRALTRRTHTAAGNIFALADLRLDADAHTVTRNGRLVELTSREYSILAYMMLNVGIVLSRDQILNHVWNMDYEGVSNMVDVYIRNLRKKVDDPFQVKLIHTVRGAGYVLREETANGR